MTQHQTDNLRIRGELKLDTPTQIIAELPVDEGSAEVVYQAREALRAVISQNDDRLAVVVGPCSIHDPDAALDYAKQLNVLREKLSDDLLIIMRVYFEKPRTTVGWKGLINDPDINGSFDINKGLRTARKVLLSINSLGLAAGTEFLDLISPQYIADLVGWGAIGARTTESQSHRELASGLSCPVGFKNGTDGNTQIAVDAIRAARGAHHFLSVTKDGHSAIFQTAGNDDCHVILRGGKHINYDAASVDDASALLEKAKLSPSLMIDFSHANSRKKHDRQRYVCADVATQIGAGDRRITGVMIESNLVEGRQDEPDVRGQSITDACVGWDATVSMLEQLAEAVRKRRAMSK